MSLFRCLHHNATRAACCVQLVPGAKEDLGPMQGGPTAQQPTIGPAHALTLMKMTIPGQPGEEEEGPLQGATAGAGDLGELTGWVNFKACRAHLTCCV